MYTGMYMYGVFISYCRSFIQYGDKFKAPVDSTELKLDRFGTKVLKIYMSDEEYLAKSLMSFSPKDMMQQTKVSY